jgi:hypothetical protein
MSSFGESGTTCTRWAFTSKRRAQARASDTTHADAGASSTHARTLGEPGAGLQHHVRADQHQGLLRLLHELPAGRPEEKVGEAAAGMGRAAQQRPARGGLGKHPVGDLVVVADEDVVDVDADGAGMAPGLSFVRGGADAPGADHDDIHGHAEALRQGGCHREGPVGATAQIMGHEHAGEHASRILRRPHET